MRTDIEKIFIAAVALAVAACTQEEAPPASEEPAATVEAEMASDIDARAADAVASPSRPEADRADDGKRKPAEVLTFTAVEPGMTVFEMEAGEGYYTDLLSMLAGPEGTVIMQTPPGFDPFLSEVIDARLEGGRLSNVRLSKTNFDKLDAEDNSVDMVTWFLGPHELYFTPSDGVSLGEPEAVYADVFRILKPGGTFVILDHAAAPGSPSSTGGAIHRIDPEIVKGLAVDAGFTLVAESDILRHPEDDKTMSVFDPAVRRMTDRFLLKYKKPVVTGGDVEGETQ
jgi:predicted methyltransferase